MPRRPRGTSPEAAGRSKRIRKPGGGATSLYPFPPQALGLPVLHKKVGSKTYVGPRDGASMVSRPLHS